MVITLTDDPKLAEGSYPDQISKAKSKMYDGYQPVPAEDLDLEEIDSRESFVKRSYKRLPNRFVIHGVSLIVVLLVATAITSVVKHGSKNGHTHRCEMSARHKWTGEIPMCPAKSVMAPEDTELTEKVMNMINGDEYRQRSQAIFSGAIQIPTQSFDDMGPVGEDQRWNVFYNFSDYLEQSFPLLHSQLTLDKINTHGALYTWEGSNSDLKPMILMAHMDVVPAPDNTADRWDHPPFSGFFDGKSVWGRGSEDTKTTLIGILEAITILLENDFKPQRTVLLSFGFDEELSGPRGARFLSAEIEKRYGADSISFIVDEGGGAIQDMWGTSLALPAIGEKGYFDVELTVETEGGHSSMPTKHTSIGMLSAMVIKLEHIPYIPELTTENPFFTTLQCAVEYAPDMDPVLKKAMEKKKPHAVTNILSESSLEVKYMIQTSQAVDIIKGGAKINALPEKATALINHRIAVEKNSDTIRKHLKRIIRGQAKRFNLSMDLFGQMVDETGTNGRVILREFQPPLEPAPLSPVDTISDDGFNYWSILSGTISHVWNNYPDRDLPAMPAGGITVAPSLMTGNTDTRWYWNLTSNIYRFSPMRASACDNMHTVNEYCGLGAHLEGVKFFHELIRNAC